MRAVVNEGLEYAIYDPAGTIGGVIYMLGVSTVLCYGARQLLWQFF